MSFETRRMMGRLVKHDIANKFNLARVSLDRDLEQDPHELEDLEGGERIQNSSNSGEIEDLSEKDELAEYEEIAGVVEALCQRLEGNYDIRSVEPELAYLKEIDPSQFGGKAAEGPEKWHEVAQVAHEYSVNSESGFEDDICLEDVFESFDGSVKYNGCRDSPVHGDRGLCMVANTISMNSKNHGSVNGEEPNVWAEVEGLEDEYKIDIWDDGTGLEDYDPEDIFEKCTGENSGLGLYLSREITNIFDGSLEYSEKNASREGGFGLEWRLKKKESDEVQYQYLTPESS